MRLLVTFLLATVLFTIAAPGIVNATNDCSATTCSASIDRSVSTTNWGVTSVSDSVTLNSTAPVSHLSLGIPGVIASHLRYSTAVQSGTQNSLQVSNLGTKPLPGGGNYAVLDVTLAATPRTGLFLFNLTNVYSDLLSYNQTSSMMRLTINPFPLVDRSFNVTSASVKIDPSDWPSPRISPANLTLTSQGITGGPIRPYNATIWNIDFSTGGTGQAILNSSAGRTITIASSGSIWVTDSYNLTNRGPVLSSIPFILPKGISDISASDVIGSVTLPPVSKNSDGTSTVTFTPRYGAVSTNNSTKVQISYQLSKQTYLSSPRVGEYVLNFRLLDNVKFYQPSLETRIVTPLGFKLERLTGAQQYAMGSNQIVVHATPLTPVSNLGFSMTYQLSPFWASLSPLSWILLLEAALAGAVLVLGARPGAAAAGLAPQSELINRFVELYDEKSSLRLESDRIEEDMNRGAMNKFDYRRRRRTIDLRMNEIDRLLVSVKEQLASMGGRYQDMIRRIERSEAELQVVRSTSIDIRNQNRSGRMSRELYESLSNDLVRRKQRAQQAIDTILINLREEIR
ncbi:MAG TPA: hypothetical protein VFE98_11075 [Candidatus Bathyarchaeia archaeon]|nr:hypothetical protein [Candidatus Bathyarchaeia archaeon]